DAGAVARREREPPVRPRHPRRRHLDAREAAEERVVLLARAAGEDRRVPGAAHRGDRSEALLLDGADGAAHPGLAQRLLAARGGRGGGAAPRRHRLEDAVEDAARIAALLDEPLPPPFAVAVAGGPAELLERVDLAPLALDLDRHPVG